jgi:6,7-dimethyl-8-ribityllumazine synthase
LSALIHVTSFLEIDMDQTDLPATQTTIPMPRVAFVHALWHSEIVLHGRDAFLDELARRGCPRERVDVVVVPGSFDIPLPVQRLAKSGFYDAVVACGFVVDGGIYRHEFVAATVVEALMRVQLDTGVPVLSAVLTPHHFHEHEPHTDFFAGHFEAKGREAAQACLTMIATLGAIRGRRVAAA